MGQYKMIHSMIRVTDLEKSLAFYQDAFGFVETRRKEKPEYNFTLVYLGDEQSGFELELTYNYDPVPTYELGDAYGHLAIEVDDLEASHERHKAAGYKVKDLSGLDAGVKSYYFMEDPDGYKIEVMRKK